MEKDTQIPDGKWLTTSAGVTMPRMIYGTAWKGERTADLVETAVRAGFRAIDTAGQPKHYNEALVGVALDRLNDGGIGRESLFLQTKFSPLSGQDPGQVPYDTAAPVARQVAQSVAASLNNLQTDHVDSLLLHSPMAPFARSMEAWQAMENIQKSGAARQLGISNFYDLNMIRALYAAAHVKPAVIQNRFYHATRYDADLRRWCAEHGMTYQSFWTLTANAHVLNSNRVRIMAQNYQRTEAQIFFRYIIQSGMVPLTGTCSEQHMREDLDIFDFELSPGDLNAVSQLLKGGPTMRL